MNDRIGFMEFMKLMEFMEVYMTGQESCKTCYEREARVFMTRPESYRTCYNMRFKY